MTNLYFEYKENEYVRIENEVERDFVCRILEQDHQFNNRMAEAALISGSESETEEIVSPEEKWRCV